MLLNPDFFEFHSTQAKGSCARRAQARVLEKFNGVETLFWALLLVLTNLNHVRSV